MSRPKIDFNTYKYKMVFDSENCFMFIFFKYKNKLMFKNKDDKWMCYMSDDELEEMKFLGHKRGLLKEYNNEGRYAHDQIFWLHEKIREFRKNEY